MIADRAGNFSLASVDLEAWSNLRRSYHYANLSCPVRKIRWLGSATLAFFARWSRSDCVGQSGSSLGSSEVRPVRNPLQTRELLSRL